MCLTAVCLRCAAQAAEFWETGIEPFPVSAISGTGTGDMLEALLASLPAPKSLQAVEEQEGPLAVAIIGRPNVGESLWLVAARPGLSH
jgi:GTP-binding protein